MRDGWTYKKLGEVCQINCGTRVVQKKDGGTIYPVYGGGGATFMMDTYNREDSLVVARFAMSKQCTRFVKGKFFLNDSGLTVSCCDSALKQDYLDQVIFSLNDKIYNSGKGAAQKNLDMKEFKNLQIPIPPLSSQQQIVSELDLLTHILDQKRQQLKEYDALAESIFYDMFGDPVENPKGWEVKKLGELCQLKNGLNYEKIDSGNLIKILGVSDFQNNRTVTSKGLTSIFLNIPVEEYLLKDNDLVFVRSNGSKSLIGRCVIIETDNEDIVFSGFCIRCRLTSNLIYPQFASFVMQTKSVRDQITNAGQGCNISNVNQKILGSFLMVVPPLPLQQTFAAKIQSIEHQKQLLKESIKATEMLFQSRMDYWFNG